MSCRCSLRGWRTLCAVHQKRNLFPRTRVCCRCRPWRCCSGEALRCSRFSSASWMNGFCPHRTTSSCCRRPVAFVRVRFSVRPLVLPSLSRGAPRTWVQRVCEAATSACSGGGASPAVALSCLVNLPPFSERLESATLRDLSRILAFARTTSSRKQDLITSAIQTEVDMSLRRISIVDGTPLQLDSESGVFPFWVDLVLTDFTPCLESFSAGRLA
mmetsp:Transcript_37757/g.100452  ORF Transcript_37757/g.100452 Transcript_37757/m.100452 type:complete len:215 (+) Transcript_37757:779-1423(+)